MSTMRDVAAVAKVSAKTVSRVFNNDPHVLPETRERVETALRELNYVPNTSARALTSGLAARPALMPAWMVASAILSLVSPATALVFRQAVITPP